MLSVVRCDKELEILHAVYLSVIILLVITIVVISVIHWRIRGGPGNRITRLTTIQINKVIESSKRNYTQFLILESISRYLSDMAPTGHFSYPFLQFKS